MGNALRRAREKRARITIAEGRAGTSRRDWLESAARERAAAGERCWLVNCDFELGGPWAGVNDLFGSLIGDILRDAPELAEQHAAELMHVLPSLKKTLKLPYASLTESVPREERVRNYAADRALRMVHGLIDLLDSWRTATGDTAPWFIVCDHYDRAGFIGRQFFRQLMRRRGEALNLSLLVAVSAGDGKTVRGWFEADADMQVATLNFVPEPDSVAAVDSRIAEQWATELERTIGSDTLGAEIHVVELVRLWKLAGRTDRLLAWKQFATEHFLHLGLYEDAGRYSDGLLTLADDETSSASEQQRLWILIKTLSAFMGSVNPAVGMPFVEKEILPRLEEPTRREHVDLFFLVAMMYARFVKPRDLAKGEAYLDRGIEALKNVELAEEERHFLYVFNRNGVAMIRSFQGRLPEAIALCSAGMARLNQHLGSDKHRLHRSVLVYNIAQVYLAMSAYAEAIEHYDKVIALDPDYSEYYNERGNILLRVGRLEEARADYLQAIRLSPPYQEVYTNLGQCYRRMGEFEKAVKCYERALDLEPKQTLALVGLGKAHEELGERELAIAHYTKALARDPLQWEVLASRGVLHYEAGDYPAALADFDEAIQQAPHEDGLQKNRAVVLSELSAVA